jgi:hypothetical protein
MTAEPMPEPEGPEDERFVYVVTAAGVECLSRRGRLPPGTRTGYAVLAAELTRRPWSLRELLTATTA